METVRFSPTSQGRCARVECYCLLLLGLRKGPRKAQGQLRGGSLQMFYGHDSAHEVGRRLSLLLHGDNLVPFRVRWPHHRSSIRARYLDKHARKGAARPRAEKGGWRPSEPVVSHPPVVARGAVTADVDRWQIKGPCPACQCVRAACGAVGGLHGVDLYYFLYDSDDATPQRHSRRTGTGTPMHGWDRGPSSDPRSKKKKPTAIHDQTP